VKRKSPCVEENKMVHAIGEINNKLVKSFLCVLAMIITEEHSHYTELIQSGIFSRAARTLMGCEMKCGVENSQIILRPEISTS
jgi:hypothetical protein